MTTHGQTEATCCTPTIALVQARRQDATCPACGESYLADLSATVPRPVGQRTDARVQVADEAVLRPSQVPPVARLTHTEDDELVRVRRLLTELRPDRGGPLGWAASGAPPAAGGSAWTPMLRVQTSVEVPAILPGAFASVAPVSAAPDLDRGFPGMPDDVRATLRWCQRSGTLLEGLRALYTACALGCATTEALAAWKAMPEGVRPAARVVAGRKRITVAMAAWWGEGAARESEGPARPSPIDGVASQAKYAAAQVEMALARVRGRVSVVVTAEGASE